MKHYNVTIQATVEKTLKIEAENEEQAEEEALMLFDTYMDNKRQPSQVISKEYREDVTDLTPCYES